MLIIWVAISSSYRLDGPKMERLMDTVWKAISGRYVGNMHYMYELKKVECKNWKEHLIDKASQWLKFDKDKSF